MEPFDNPEKGDERKDEDGNTSYYAEEYANAVDVAYESAVGVLLQRRYSEFSPSNKHSVSFIPSPTTILRSAARKRAYGQSKGGAEGAIIMKGLGDWRRYGIQPLRVSYEEQLKGASAGSSLVVGLYTVRGGHFDGEIRISVERSGPRRGMREGTGLPGSGGGIQIDSGKNLEGMDDENKENERPFEDAVVISVSLMVPKRGRKVSEAKCKR